MVRHSFLDRIQYAANSKSTRASLQMKKWLGIASSYRIPPVEFGCVSRRRQGELAWAENTWREKGNLVVACGLEPQTSGFRILLPTFRGSVGLNEPCERFRKIQGTEVFASSTLKRLTRRGELICSFRRNRLERSCRLLVWRECRFKCRERPPRGWDHHPRGNFCLPCATYLAMSKGRPSSPR
jgi:hypothetical protein